MDHAPGLIPELRLASGRCFGEIIHNLIDSNMHKDEQVDRLETCSEEEQGVGLNGPLAQDQGPFRLSITAGEVNELPRRVYEGPRILVRDEAGLKKALKVLRKEEILGFDTETRPSFQKGESYLPSLLQLAGQDEVYVFQLNQFEDLGPLFSILEKKQILKVGVAMGYDVRQLQELRPFNPAGFLDLEKLTDSVGITNNGLRKLAAIVLGFRISKGEQRSNWARSDLTDRQLAYAATDAWVSREIYLALIGAGATLKVEGRRSKAEGCP